jgi:hypothetical protein
MQEANEVGKYVTDGKHTYPYNMYLDEDINAGRLKYCEKPAAPVPHARPATFRKPETIPLEERELLASKLGITVGDLGNMSPQELAEAEAELELKAPSLTDGFPKA